jgi:hypothetical protein
MELFSVSVQLRDLVSATLNIRISITWSSILLNNQRDAALSSCIYSSF